MVHSVDGEKDNQVSRNQRLKENEENEGEDEDEAADMDEFMASGLVDQEDKVILQQNVLETNDFCFCLISVQLMYLIKANLRMKTVIMKLFQLELTI